MTDPSRAIVTDGGGFLGRAAIARLTASGTTVLAPRRAALDWRDALAHLSTAPSAAAVGASAP